MSIKKVKIVTSRSRGCRVTMSSHQGLKTLPTTR